MTVVERRCIAHTFFELVAAWGILVHAREAAGNVACASDVPMYATSPLSPQP